MMDKKTFELIQQQYKLQKTLHPNTDHVYRLNKKNLEMNEMLKNNPGLNQTITNFTNDLRSSLFGIIKTANDMGRMVKQYFDTVEYQKGWNRIREGLVETEEDIKAFKSSMVKMGYPPHASLSVVDMRFIAKKYETNRQEMKDYIDEFMCAIYPPEKIRKISLDWEDKDFIRKRLPLLRNAVMAHNLGMYDLVVPALITQLEGILVDAFEITGEVNGRVQKILLKYLLVKNKEPKSVLDFEDAIYTYFSQQVLEKFNHGEKTKFGVSRHAILHGSDTDFGKESTSLKLILLFDFLASAIANLTPETVQSAIEEVGKTRNIKVKIGG